MSAFANLIMTENYFKEYSTVNMNVDMKVVTPVLFEVQDMYIKPLLGTKLFNQILTEIQANTVTSENQTLLNDYVLPCMIQYTKAELLPELKYRLQNKGVMVKSSENSSAADLQEIQFLIDRAKNKGEWYAERTTKFLKRYASATVYPLYLDNVECDEIRPNKTNFTSGIFVDDDDLDDYNIRIGNY